MIAFNRTLSLALLLTVIAGPAVAASPPGWNLVFEDLFDELSLDNWDLIDTNITTNNSQQDYLPEQVSVSDGKLVITSENIPSRGRPYRSGQVMSTQTWHRGRFEVVADLPESTGMWPAIWLLPDVDQWPWPSQGEIDIMENRGNQPNLTSGAFHWGTNPPFSHAFFFGEFTETRFGNVTNFHEGFHTYTVEWEPDQIRYYVDDVQYFVVYDENVGDFISNQTAPMNLVINTAIGGHFLPNPDDSTIWPQEFLIDSVRVFERSDELPLRSLRNGSFEENDGSLAGWFQFANAGMNISVDDVAVLEGDASLKLFGLFASQPTLSGVIQSVDVMEGDRFIAGASAYVDSSDSISGTDNSAVLVVEFYDERDAPFGSEHLIGAEVLLLADAMSENDLWHHRELSALVPSGAVEARVGLGFLQPGVAAGAVHIDNVSFRTFAVPEPSGVLLLMCVVGGGICGGNARRRTFLRQL